VGGKIDGNDRNGPAGAGPAVSAGTGGVLGSLWTGLRPSGQAGAADFAADGDVFEITTEPDDFSGVRDDLEAKGYSFVSAEVEMIPDVYTVIEDPDLCIKMEKLLDMLEDNDDVQNVWHNWERPEE